jgi:hypothetical protein
MAEPVSWDRALRWAARLALVAVLGAFVYDSMRFGLRWGQGPLRGWDAGSEWRSYLGAREFLAEGFGPTAGLPRYGPHSSRDSGSEAILRSDVYTHYLPGPDYVLAAGIAVLGDEPASLAWIRLLPLLHVVLAVLALVRVAEWTLWGGHRLIAPLVAFALLFTPAMRPWALSLHGHAYTSAYLLLGLALGLAGAQGGRLRWLRLAAFVLGFLSNYMLLTAAFVVCAAPLVGAMLAGRDWRSAREGFWLAVLTGLGLTAAFGVHFLQVASLFGLREAVRGQLGVAGVRLSPAWPGWRTELLVSYELRVGRFFHVGLASLMLALGLAGAWLFAGPASRRIRLACAALIASAASWAWIFAVPGHSLHHKHVNPRLFLLLFACSLLSLGAAAATRLPRGVGAATDRRSEDRRSETEPSSEAADSARP